MPDLKKADLRQHIQPARDGRCNLRYNLPLAKGHQQLDQFQLYSTRIHGYHGHQLSFS